MVLRRLLLVPKIGQDLFAEETHGALHLLVGDLTHVDIQKQVADPCIPQLGHLLRYPFGVPAKKACSTSSPAAGGCPGGLGGTPPGL